jgi:hypothetical protein
VDDGQQEAGGQAAHTLRQDLGTEYYAIMKVVSEYDGRLMIIKGWSVTLSLAGLGLGFQQGHFALFALAAGTALAFWFIDGLMKRHQMRYYSRMRDIEVAAFHLNHLAINDQTVSAPRVDWYWGFGGRGRDYRADIPQRLTPHDLRTMLGLAPWMGHVLLPHAVAVVLGVGLFIGAVTNVPGLDQLQP